MKKQLTRIKYSLNEWFEMSKSERNGVTILVIFILLMIGYNYAAPFLYRSDKTDYSHLSQEITDWLASANQAQNRFDKPDNSTLLLGDSPVKNGQLFKFNPNDASIEEFEKLGLTKRQAQTVKKYLEKGGSFKTKKDFSKMYFLTEEFYKRLHPYIDLPESIDYSQKKDNYNFENSNQEDRIKENTPYKKFDYSNLRVEINSADTTELKKIKGIGSFTAKKIVQFREHLGGFTSIDQLAEVYPLNMEKLDSMRQYLLVDLGLMQKINVNEVTAEQLSKHPYLTSAQAKSLIAYRTMHGNFKQVEDIKKSALIDQKTYEKAKDYLRVN